MEAALTTSTPSARVTNSKLKFRAGLVLSALPVLFLLFDGVIKLVKIAPVVQSFAQLGYPDGLARGLGLLELLCVALYAIPRSALLGAILLTGFLGGAISTHLRIGDPFFSHTAFPVYVALLLWGGLYLRDGSLRALLPLHK
ncbi:MAG: DoxX family protein [Polyangiaceae bacterium]